MKKGEYVFLTDWFSKKIIEVEGVDGKIQEFFSELKDCGKRDSLVKIADCVEKKMRTSEVALYMVSDTRLPTSSLYHHMKNTAGIAVPLAIDEDPTRYWGPSNEEERAKLRISSILHDIGKFVAQGKGKKHVEKGKEILDDIVGEWDINPKLKDGIVDNAIRHHSNDYYDPYLPKSKIQKIISKADSVASGMDRNYELVYDTDRETLTNEDDIFPHRIQLGGKSYLLKPRESVEVGSLTEYEAGYGRKYVLLNDETVNGGFVDMSDWDYKIDGTIGILRMDISGIQKFISSGKSLDTIRGASAIIEEAEKAAADVISHTVSRESVIYMGGGNMIAFIPTKKIDEIRSLVEKETEKVLMWPESGTRPVVVADIFSLSDVSSSFSDCIEHIVRKADSIKSEPLQGLQSFQIHSDELCTECNERKANTSVRDKKVCLVCKRKMEVGRERKFSMEGTEEFYLGYTRPTTTEEISGRNTSTGNIAVIQMDGNRMGVLFKRTRTPAEYSMKSMEFNNRMRSAIRAAIEEVHTKNREKDNRYSGGKRDAFWLDVLYIGGDDIVILSDARYAVRLAKTISEKVEESFHSALSYYNTPIVTVSGGIAIARHDFPIYFLFSAADAADHEAKKLFRRKISGDGKIPSGSISISVVNTTMPSDTRFTYLTDDEDIEEIVRIMEIASEQGGDRNHMNLVKLFKTTMQEISSAPDDETTLFNLRKFYYSNYSSKERLRKLIPHMQEEFGTETGAEMVEFLSEYLKDGDKRKAMKAMFPMVVV